MEKDVISQLKEFIEESKDRHNNRQWLCDDKMKVYVRKGHHLLGTEMRCTLDVASIEVDEDEQGNGLFSSFMEAAERLNPWDAVYIESILSEVVCEWCIRHGWTEAPLYPVSFYKLK